MNRILHCNAFGETMLMPRETATDPLNPVIVTRSLNDAAATASSNALAAGSNAETASGYGRALDYLYGRINYEKIGHAPYNSGNYRLDRMRQLLDLLGNPQLDYEVIHIAGTKGKGTTATLIADGLRNCGRRVGFYSSPHLLCLEERIQFQGAACAPSELVSLTATVREAAEQLEAAGGGRPTFFELTTAMGMLHFSRKRADSAVLEVGLGGRLDSTNVCRPALTLITSIGLDHQAQLGDTIPKIAAEKAGIIKPGIPVVCTALDPEAREVIATQAEALAAPLALIDRDFRMIWHKREHLTNDPQLPAAELHFDGPCGMPPASRWSTRLLGRHQAANIAGAVMAFCSLNDRNWQLPWDKLQSAVAVAHPRARLEVVSRQPLSILDTAHNPDSIRAGLAAIADHFSGRRIITVFAASRDKDYRAMLSLLLDVSHLLVVTRFHGNPRAVSIDELEAAAHEILQQKLDSTLRGQQVLAIDVPAQAWHIAQARVEADDLIYATGSFFLAAELLSEIEPAARKKAAT